MASNIKVKAGNTVRVASVTIGRPVRRVVQSSGTLEGLGGIDASGKTTGSILVYDASTNKWTATTDLEDQNINGGSY